jgi:hypothetical protein
MGVEAIGEGDMAGKGQDRPPAGLGDMGPGREGIKHQTAVCRSGRSEASRPNEARGSTRRRAANAGGPQGGGVMAGLGETAGVGRGGGHGLTHRAERPSLAFPWARRRLAVFGVCRPRRRQRLGACAGPFASAPLPLGVAPLAGRFTVQSRPGAPPEFLSLIVSDRTRRTPQRRRAPRLRAS